jgi:signal peptidase I
MKRKRFATLVLAVVALALIRLAAFRGLVAPLRIAGPSMAETLIGDHFEFTCEDCRFPFRCDAERPSATDLAVCPNCGFPRNHPLHAQRGQRVVVDQLAYWFSAPKRWELVALRSANRALVVKRVVGLPGETIAVRRGDVHVDGRILRKSLSEFRRLATLVHDDTHRPGRSSDLPSRWHGESEVTDWRPTPRGYRWSPTSRVASDAGEPRRDWLAYQHWRCYASPFPRSEPAPISDNCAFNQAESRALRNVTDILVSCRVSLADEASLDVRLHDGRGFILAHVEAARHQIAVGREGHGWEATRQLPAGLGSPWQLEFGTFDQQAVVAIGGTEAAHLAWPDPPDLDKASPTPVAIAAGGGLVEIENLRIFRDIHYLDPRNLGIDWELADRLRDDELCVLGDNAAVSQDSRSWPTGHLSRKTLFGRILAFPFQGRRRPGMARSAEDK